MPGEKTEKATPKRKQDERKKGNIFQSHEVVTVFSMIVLFYSFKLIGPFAIEAIQKCIRLFLTRAATTSIVTADDVRIYFLDGCMAFLVTAMPMLLIGGMVAIAVTLAQTRGLVSFKPLAFKPSRMNPLSGIKKMFSLRGVVELFKSVVKILVLGYICWKVMKAELPGLPRMMDLSVRQSFVITGNIILSIVKTAAIIFVFLAAFDYFYQWWEYEKNLRMSKQDIKEEYKQTEGDPQIKGKIKERQQAQARKRMMQAVPSADVVIRNPTHFAVAVRYDPDRHNAPVVVAKGADHLALKIVEVAEANDITTIENKPLARGLYDAVELDMEIPEQFYQPVAEVLAFVYSLKKKDLN